MQDQKSTFSAETEQSKPWTGTATLGKKIVKEFGLESGFDTLGRWMAHRIAELIRRAETLSDETERENAKREAADLIMKFWEKRTHWLYASPLAEIADFLAHIAGQYNQKSSDDKPEETGNNWTGILGGIIELNDREIQVCRSASLAEHSLEEEREWLDNHRANLSKEEINIIEKLLTMRASSESEYFYLGGERVPKFGLLAPEERTKKTLEILDQIESQRRELYGKIFRTESMESAAEQSDQ